MLFLLQALTEVNHIVVTLKAGGVAPHERRRKPTEPTQAVTKFVQSDALMRALIDFVHNAEALESITFDNLKLGAEMALQFGFALSNTKSAIKVLTFQNCPLAGSGLRTLTPHISKLTTLNVLTLENCGLADDAIMYVASIIRANESHMDQLYWNSTLRMDSNEDGLTFPGLDTDELSNVYCSGLVMLDISRNQFSSACMTTLARIIKSNHWLLGLNLRGNCIDAKGFENFYPSLEENSALETLLVGINPGFSKSLAGKVRRSVKDTVTKLDSMPNDLFERFAKWNTIQAEEAEGRDGRKEPVPEPTEDKKKFSKKKSVSKPVVKRDSGVSSSNAGANGQQTTPPRGPGVTRWNEGEEENELTSPFRGAKDSFEFAIPTPTDDVDAYHELNTSAGVSPAVSLHSKVSGDFPLDGRPPSRNSLRPRSAHTQSYDVNCSSHPLSSPMRASLPTKWLGMSGKGKMASTGRPSSASGYARSKLEVSNVSAKFEKNVPFYPSGSSTSAAYAEVRASNALANRRSLFRGQGSSSQPRANTVFKTTHQKKRAKKIRAKSADSNGNFNNKLDVLASAVERVTTQLLHTAEKLQDVSDSISETALNMSNLTPMGQAAASSMINMSHLDTSIGSIGADINRGSAQASPIRTRQSPSHHKELITGIAKTRAANEDLKALIKENIRKKLSEYAASS